MSVRAIEVYDSSKETLFNNPRHKGVGIDSNDGFKLKFNKNGTIVAVEEGQVGGSTLIGRSVLALDSFQSTTGVGNGADATDDTLYTFTLPASALSGGSGKQRVIISAEVESAANGNTKTIKFMFGATPVTITLNPTTTAPNAKKFSIWIEVAMGADNAHQTIYVAVSQAGASEELVSITASTETGTNALVMKITGSSGSSAANDLLLKSAEVLFAN